MMEKFWKSALAVGGIAAIGAFVFWSLYKDWLALPIFSKLSQDQTFSIMQTFLLLTFVALVMFIIAFILGARENHKTAQGGKGGAAVAHNGGTAIGGAGGAGGIGPGGAGGDAVADGKGSFTLGGEGGEGAQKDRPARGGRGPLEVLGQGDKVIPGVGRLGDFGRGGNGAFGDIPAQPGGSGLAIIEFLGSTPHKAETTTAEKGE